MAQLDLPKVHEHLAIGADAPAEDTEASKQSCTHFNPFCAIVLPNKVIK